MGKRNHAWWREFRDKGTQNRRVFRANVSGHHAKAIHYEDESRMARFGHHFWPHEDRHQEPQR